MVIIVITIAILHSHHPNNDANSSNTAAVSSNQVTIQNYMFSPMAITVKVGTKVTWNNQDPVHHSITADNGSQDAPNSPLIGKGESYSFTFTKVGTYSFHCMPHPYMHSTIIVTN